jgi:hypothetical protein
MLKNKSKTKKNATIKPSIHGPVIIFEDQIYFLDQGQQLFDIIDNDPELLFLLNNSMIEHFNLSIAPILQSLKEKTNYAVMPMASSLNAVHSYYRFIYSDYLGYRQAVARAVFDTSDVEAMVALNHKLVNEFYGLTKNIDKEQLKKYMNLLKD